MRLLAALHVEDADFSEEGPLKDAVRAVQVEARSARTPLPTMSSWPSSQTCGVRRGAHPSTCTRTRWQPS
eukprot:1946777-Alexandrium_andersonii.AAC.1